MKSALRVLTARLGEGYGRTRLMWYCQKYNVFPTENKCPNEMYNEIKMQYSYGRAEKNGR